ncbi:uncharacterized protein LOC144026850 [Festucalex cinctus]
MCKVKMLKELMKERLNVAAEEIFELFERTITDYEEKLCRSNEANERRQNELVATIADLRVQLKKGVQQQRQRELPSKKQGETEIKTEEQDVRSSQNAAQLPELSEHSPSDERKSEVAGEHFEDVQSEPDSLFAPLSDIEDITSNSSGIEHRDDDREAHTDDDDIMKHYSDKKDYHCSQCEKSFYSKAGLKNHMLTHPGDKPKKYSMKNFVKRRKRKRTDQTTEAGERSQVQVLKTRKNSNGGVTDANIEFNCALCEKTFYNRQGLKQHMETHTRTKRFVCQVCEKRFSWKHHLKRHMCKHTRDEALRREASERSQAPPSNPKHGEESVETDDAADAGNHQCLQCGKKCPSSASLMAHMVIHTGAKPFACAVCGQCFSFRQSMVRHEKQHYGQNPFTCTVCRKSFLSRGRLIVHLRLHMKEEAEEKPVNSDNLSQHAAAKADPEVGDEPHSDVDTDSTLNSSDTYYTDGEEAASRTEKFKDYADIQQVLVGSEDEPPGARRSSLDEELLQGNRIVEEAPISDMDDDFDCEREKSYPSSFSHEKFSFKAQSAHTECSSTRAELGSNRREDSDNRRCYECKKTFSSRAGLKRHMMQHTGEKPYLCSLCDKRFSLKEYLNRHMTTHTGWNCQVCGKTFTKRRAFSEHMITHTGEKPAKSHSDKKCIKCRVCGESFFKASDFVAHMETHAAEKPATSKKRIKSHSGKKPLRCPICAKTFGNKSYFPQHMRIHTGEKPFQCNKCFQRFRFKYRIKNHKCDGEANEKNGDAGQLTADKATAHSLST